MLRHIDSCRLDRIDFHEMSVNNYQLMPSNNPEEQTAHLSRGGGLESRKYLPD
jgi:hypothetical protein